jgi:hypothetical protein
MITMDNPIVGQIEMLPDSDNSDKVQLIDIILEQLDRQKLDKETFLTNPFRI